MFDSYRGKIVIEYSADKDKMLSLINEINEHASKVSVLARKLGEAFREDGETKEQ